MRNCSTFKPCNSFIIQQSLTKIVSFKILIMIVLALIYSFCFEDTVSLSIPITRHDFCQTPLYNSRVTKFESWTISHTFAVILAATRPPPRWRGKPWKGLLKFSRTKTASCSPKRNYVMENLVGFKMNLLILWHLGKNCRTGRKCCRDDFGRRPKKTPAICNIYTGKHFDAFSL